MPKNYYSILGVSEQASQEEIRKAFRELAHIHHPDRGGREKTFKEITEAYNVLGNETRRRSYDFDRKHSQDTDSRGPEKASEKAAAVPVEKDRKKSYYVAAIVAAFVVGVSLYNLATSDEPSTGSDVRAGDDTLASLQTPSELQQESYDRSETIILGSEGADANETPVHFSSIEMQNLGSVLNGSFGYSTYQPRTTGGEFLRVTFEAMNTGRFSESVTVLSLKMVDVDGREFYPEQVYHCNDPYTETRAYQKAHDRFNTTMSLVMLKPGIPCEWTMLFEVPAGVNSYTLQFSLK